MTAFSNLIRPPYTVAALILLTGLWIIVTPSPASAQPAGALENTDGLTGNALAEGNTLFAAGDLDAAATAYERGYRPEQPHPTLIYNLATTLHHLGRLPEAIAWYRRGDASDPWLEDNLWLARRSLGNQRLPPPGQWQLLTTAEPWLLAAGILVGWLSLGALLLPRGRWLVWCCGVGVGLLLYGAGLWIGINGPDPAVLVADCEITQGVMPAGTELWVQPSVDGWKVAGTRDRCAAEAIRLAQ